MSFSNSKRDSNSGNSLTARNPVSHLGRRNKAVNYNTPMSSYPIRSARSQSKVDINKSVTFGTPAGRSGIYGQVLNSTPKNNPMVNRALINLATSRSPVLARSARA